MTLISSYSPPAERRSRRKHCCDECFFDEMDALRAYWLGYIIADGCVSIRTRRDRDRQFMFQVASKDIEHLEKLRTAMQSSYPVYGPHRGCWQLAIPSYRLCASLERYGVVPRKSLISRFPELPDAFQLHLIRGIVDGDGCIYPVTRRCRAVKHNGRGRPPQPDRIGLGISVVGSRHVCDQIRKKFDVGSVRPKSAVWSWQTAGPAAAKIVHALYEDPRWPSLNRKRAKAVELGAVKAGA